MNFSTIGSSIHDLGLDEKAWDALLASSPTNTIFQTFQYLSAWEKTFKDLVDPLYVTAYDSFGVAGVAPLMVKSEEGTNVLKFLADGRADYGDMVYVKDRPDVLEGIFDAVFSIRDRWDCIELNSIPVASPTIVHMRELCRRYGCRMIQRNLYLCPALLIHGHEEQALKVFNKSGLRRRQNFFQRQGCLRFQTLFGSHVEPYLDCFFEQHINRWAGTNTPSLFLDKRNRTFYRALTEAMADKEWLVLSVVELNDRPLAMHVGFDYNGRLLWYKPSFDVTHKKHSPGLVLLRYLIGTAIERNRHELDFSIGGEPFKFRFANIVRTTAQVQIFRDFPTFVLAWARHRARELKANVMRRG